MKTIRLERMELRNFKGVAQADYIFGARTDIRGGNPLIVERTLREDWVKPRGTTELVCKGLKSEYAVNEVPITKTQYLAKIDEILPSERWFTLSSIGIIPAMDQKTCRAALQAIAPAIDERALAKTLQRQLVRL